jgi:endo-1,4-beta-D-glucanase Y
VPSPEPEPEPSGGTATGGQGGSPAVGGDAGSAGAEALLPQRPFGTASADYVAESILPSGNPADLAAATADFYDAWKASYVKPGCETGNYYMATGFDEANLTLSEGVGYGMIATAYLAGHDPEARTLFDGLYRLFRDHPAASSEHLMAWYLNQDCEPVYEGTLDDVSQSDGDLDIAYALLLADTQWGSCGPIDYRAEAERVIAAVAEHELDATERFVRLGDWPSQPPWTHVMRSSDFMPGHFAAFAAATSAEPWSALADGLFTDFATLQQEHAAATGLIPDFILYATGSAEPASGGVFTAEDAAYFWNACRVPWRLGVHFLLTGEARAQALLQPLNAWAEQATGGDPLAFAAGYELDGTPLPTWEFIEKEESSIRGSGQCAQRVICPRVRCRTLVTPIANVSLRSAIDRGTNSTCRRSKSSSPRSRGMITSVSAHGVHG